MRDQVIYELLPNVCVTLKGTKLGPATNADRPPRIMDKVTTLKIKYYAL